MISNIGLVFIIVAHSAEALMVFYFLRNVNFANGAKQTWISLTLLLGYPVLVLAHELSIAAKPKEDKKIK